MISCLLCRWSKGCNHHFTDAVLTMIEASPQMKVSFGLDKGDVSGAVNSGGKKAKDHHETLARDALLGSENSSWVEADMPALITAVKNRIPMYAVSFHSCITTHLLYYRLKSSYIIQKDKMSLTGQGLVHSGRVDEMTDGSEIKNIWGM